MSEQSSHHHPDNLESRLGPLPDNVEQSVSPEAEIVVGAELMDASLESGRAFLVQNTELINGMKQNEQELMSTLQTGQNTLNQLRYGNIPKHTAVLQLREVAEYVMTLVGHQNDAVNSQLRQDAITFINAASEIAEDASRLAQESDFDDQARMVIRQTETAADEIQNSVNIMNRSGDDRTQSVGRLVQLVEELEYDQWGAETIAFQINMVLEQLEEVNGDQYRSILRIENELETLSRITSS